MWGGEDQISNLFTWNFSLGLFFRIIIGFTLTFIHFLPSFFFENYLTPLLGTNKQIFKWFSFQIIWMA